MSIISQIPKPSFIFDPSQANENRDVLTQIRRIAEETGQSSPAYTRTGPPDFVNKRTVNKAGILVEAPANVPAVSFDQAFNKGYLAEAGATNLLLNSNDPSAGTWSSAAGGVTVTDTGNFFGDLKIWQIEVPSSGTGRFRPTSVSAGDHTSWCVFRPVSGMTGLRLRFGNDFNINIDYTISTDSFSGSFINAKSQKLADGFIAIWASVNLASSGTVGVGYYGLGSAPITFDFVAGDFKTGSFFNSHIKTSGSTASRGADNLVFTDAQDIIGQQSGVWLWRGNIRENQRIIDIVSFRNEGSQNNRIRVLKWSNVGEYRILIGNTGNASAQTINITSKPIGDVSILVGYDFNGDFKFAINGDVTTVAMTAKPDVTLNSIRNSQTESQILNSTIENIIGWNNSAWLTDELASLLTR